MTPLTQENLCRLLRYDPDTGAWTWLVRRGGTANVGARAGWAEKSTGYIRIAVCGIKEYAHRLAFLYMKGELPPEDVDHRDGNGLNCRWKNLRLASTTENLANKAVQRNCRSKIKGVRRRGRGWEVRLSKHGKLVHRSVHNNSDDAAAAYWQAAVEHFGEFARSQ